jgi:hypothetical protein
MHSPYDCGIYYLSKRKIVSTVNGYLQVIIEKSLNIKKTFYYTVIEIQPAGSHAIYIKNT